MPDRSSDARRLHAVADFAAAEAAYIDTLALHPHDAELQHDYAVLLMQTRREEQAIAWFERALAARPSIDSSLALLLCLRTTGRIARARTIAATLVEQVPSHAMAWLLKGSLDVIAGAHATAEPALRRCVQLDPSLGEAWHYLGEALQALQRWREAIQAYRVSMRSQPAEIFNIALCCERAGLWHEALAGYRRMLRMHPNRADVMVRLAQAEAMCCRFEEEAGTIAQLHRLLATSSLSSFALPPDDRPEAFPLAYLPLDNTFKAGLLQRHAASIAQRASQHVSHSPPKASSETAHEKLRIGYLSADFGEHPVGELIQGVFAAHDRAIVEVYGYSLRRHGDKIAKRIRNGLDHFRDMESMPSAEIADLIGDDALDVLIDLGGYTQGARPEVLALRPAPIQLGWLGFIHGHQAPWLDGLLLDECMQPATTPWPYQDRIIRLSTPMFPGFPQPSGRADRRRFGLPEDVPLLASFNTSYKLDEALISAWVSILQQAPSAWMLVCLPAYARDGFLRNWCRFGGPKRLVFGDRLSRAEQADRAASCDLFLDAFRYQAGATAVSSLAAGLPILTRTGDTPLSRSGTSLNRYLGMNELVCADTAGYVAKAIELATTPDALPSLRQRLAQALARTDLFDPRRSAADVETIVMSRL